MIQTLRRAKTSRLGWYVRTVFPQLKSAALSLVFFIISVVQTFAQHTAADLVGTVTDSSVAAFPSANAAFKKLDTRADQARPQERCFLYAELVSRMTNIAGLQFGTGDSAAGEETLSLIRQYAFKLQASIANDSKKLKSAETLLQHTSFRLEEILHESSYENRSAVEMTLEQVNNVQTQLLLEVFKK